MKQDKLKHLYWGAIIALGIIFVMEVIWFYTPIIPTIIAGIIGAGKEVIWDDKLGKGQVEFLDFVTTLVGALIIEICIGMFYW